MDKTNLRDFYRARSLARWSYVGILVPLIGIILGAMSLSASKHIETKERRAAQRVDDVRRVASWGIALSVAVIVAGGWWGYVYATNVEKANQQAIEQQQREADYEDQQQTINAIGEELRAQELRGQLAACLDEVNNWATSQKVYTTDQASLLLEARQQYINECQIRYSQ